MSKMRVKRRFVVTKPESIEGTVCNRVVSERAINQYGLKAKELLERGYSVEQICEKLRRQSGDIVAALNKLGVLTPYQQAERDPNLVNGPQAAKILNTSKSNMPALYKKSLQPGQKPLYREKHGTHTFYKKAEIEALAKERSKICGNKLNRRPKRY